MVLVAHNELGHDAVKVKDYDGKVVTECPLYPGMTCRDHVDAAVDIDSTRDENLVAVPFIELCPNSWLVPPTGAPVPIAEADQFSPAKIKAQVKALRKDWGPVLSSEACAQIVNALGQVEAATDNDAWGKALQALAGVARFAPKPHAALKALVAVRMAQIDEPVGWAVEEIDEGSEPLAERRKAMQTLRKRVGVAVYDTQLPALKAMDAWLAKHAPPAK